VVRSLVTSSKRAVVTSVAVVTLFLSGVAVTPSVMAAGTGRVSQTAGCAAEAPNYPGSRLTDCVALRDNTVYLDHTVVKASWSLTADEFGFTNVCAAVSIRNHNAASYFFNDFNMTLRPPSGGVWVLNFTAKNPLNDGFIAPGGVARGNICFDYFGEAGRYVAMYSPHPGRPVRGIWLVHIR
jgi:hypothetical protein